MNYQINRGGQQSGPYSLADLQNMLSRGQIAPGDLAWCDGMPNWLPVAHVLPGVPAAPVWAGQQPFVQRAEVPGYAQVCGILGLILAIVGFCVPIVGVLFITPLAIVGGVFALYGRYRGIGIAILVITLVDLIISPTFWLNLGAGAISPANAFLTLFDAAGVVAMFVLLVRRRA